MATYVLRRLILLAPTLLGISLLVFLLMRFLPGDVVQVMLGTEAQLGPEQRETLYRLFGLDAPLHVQYLRWLGDLLRGDLGVSLRTAEPVTRVIARRLPITVELAVLAAALSWLIAVPLGTLAAVRRHGVLDFLAHLLGLVGLSVPNFWLATMLLLTTSLYLRWQPAGEWLALWESPRVNLEHMVLPVLSLSAALVAVVMRMTRSAMLEVLAQEYIRTARAKGVAESRVLARHAFKNAAIPVITVMGVQVGYLLGGAVVIEVIYGLPGVGWMILNGIYQRDYPLVQGGVLLVGVAFVLVNLVVDVAYAYLDPRIRYD
ncbi:MAG TPA: ABC transporter permease [Methylomirabilota bacterium]|jgi:peptide/nickel transport system permease protein|nr:ABC transporter permease [Methylomirabilota bacterium]